MIYRKCYFENFFKEVKLSRSVYRKSIVQRKQRKLEGHQKENTGTVKTSDLRSIKYLRGS